MDEWKGQSLITAVSVNDVETLKTLLDSPKWYQLTDKKQNTLLQIAILKNHRETFDHLLSLENFPLESRNNHGETAIITALRSFTDDHFGRIEGRVVDEYFAVELLKKGANAQPIVLDYAAFRFFVQAAKLILERIPHANGGLDQCTPLHTCLDGWALGCEFEALLLCYGADTLTEDAAGYTSLELALYDTQKSAIAETLCFYTIDERTELKLHLSLLLRLAHANSPLLHLVVDHVSEVIVDESEERTIHRFFLTSVEFMSLLIEKCNLLMVFVLIASSIQDQFTPFTVSTRLSFENLSSFVKSTFNCDLTRFVGTLDSNALFSYFTQTNNNIEESTFTEIICFLLAHNFRFNELDVQLVFQKYGYCDLFKIMLHMDFEVGLEDLICVLNDGESINKTVLPIFIYDVNLNLQLYLEDPSRYSVRKVSLLLDYFADGNLKHFFQITNPQDIDKLRRLPRVPSLLQLARDSFRAHLVNKFKFVKAQQFYSYIHCLPINNVYKKIITFETKVY